MKIKFISIFVAILAISGCATPNVTLPESFWQDHQQKIVVANGTIPKPELYQQGQVAGGEMLINRMISDQFQQYLSHYSLKSIADIRTTFTTQLKEHQMNAHVYERPIDIKKLHSTHGKEVKQFASKDFTPLVAQVGKNKLLIVSVDAVGATRRYYSLIPLGAPKAMCVLNGKLVDLRDNRVLWRYKSKVVLAVEGNWNQPPNYVAFSKTLEQAISLAKQELVDSFFSA